MPRNDFISDNLVHMRDRLKENTARVNGEIPEEPQKPKLSDRIARQGQSETERTRNDLKGRIERDLAAVAAELELACHRRDELEKYKAVLENLSTEIDSGEVEKIRFTYFQAAGRASAYLKGPLLSTASLEERSGERKSFRQAFKESLPLGMAIIAAAAIVAGTLTVLFG